MQKQLDAVAIGVIVLGVLALIGIFWYASNNPPEKLADPPQVNTAAVQKPNIDVSTGSGDPNAMDGSGGGGFSTPGGGFSTPGGGGSFTPGAPRPMKGGRTSL